MSCPMGPPCELWILPQFSLYSLYHSPPLTSHNQKTIFFIFFIFFRVYSFLAFSDISFLISLSLSLSLSLLSEERVSLIFIHLYFLRPIKQALFSLSLSLSLQVRPSPSHEKSKTKTISFPCKRSKKQPPSKISTLQSNTEKRVRNFRETVFVLQRETDRPINRNRNWGFYTL